jgi:peroxiredoxin Q/BCP
VGADGLVKEEWRGLKVPGHVEEVLTAVKSLNEIA